MNKATPELLQQRGAVISNIKKHGAEFANGAKGFRWKDAFSARLDWQKQLAEVGITTWRQARATSAYFARSTNGNKSRPIRSYTRRKQREDTAHLVASTPDLPHCPRCGLNLLIYRTALAVALKHSGQ